MCTRDRLRSAGRPRHSHHQGCDGHGFLSGVSRRKLVRSHQTAPEEDMKLSIRDLGQATVVEVEGDVDLGTSPDLRRTLFATLPNLPKDARLALNLKAVRYIDSSGIATLIEALKNSQ